MQTIAQLTKQNIVQLTKSFEGFLKQHVPYIVRHDLQAKHQNMANDVFLFMRATFYAFVVRYYLHCRHLIDDVPKVLAVGDLHVGNFGSWRDKFGRLCWGINDVDEAHYMPFTIDLVRLAASARIAIRQNHLSLRPAEAYAALLEGYVEQLKKGGRAFVLEEDHLELRTMIAAKLKDPTRFWNKLDAETTYCSVGKFMDGFNVLMAQLPDANVPYRFGQRTAGQGSLGRPRLVGIADYNGGFIAHEVKACVPSACVWAGVAPGQNLHYNEILDRSFRSKDPFLGEENKVVHRRLSPSCSRVELIDLPKNRDEYLLLRCMGAETANIHLGTPRPDVAKEILACLKKLDKYWLRDAVKTMLKSVGKDQADWAEHYEEVQVKREARA